MKHQFLGFSLLTLCGSLTVSAQFPPPPPGGYTVDDVVGQFNKIQLHGDALGLHKGVGQDPDLCRHYQGMARCNGSDGTPYFILTRAGNAGFAVCAGGAGDHPGELLIVRMGSRPKHGERMRPNRLAVDANMDDTVAPANDVGVTSIVMDDDDEFGVGRWDHLGDGQVVDGVFVLTLEHRDTDENDGAIMFLDVWDPENPQKLPYEIVMDGAPGNHAQMKVGVSAITKDPVTGKYLMLFNEGDSKTLHFWESQGTNSAGTNLFAADLQFAQIFEMNVDQAGVSNWEKWQNLDFIRQTPDLAHPNGRLFFAAADNVDPEDDGHGSNWIRLFEVNRTNNSFTLTYRAERHLNVDSPFMGNCAAGSGFYVSPAGNLMMYICEHDNQGPASTIRAGEYRSYDVSQTGATVDGHAWVELYQDQTGWDEGRDRSLMLDTIDIAQDDFWLDLDHENGWGDDADSVRYWAPAGTKIIFFKDQNFNGAALPIIANGTVQNIPDLGGFGDSIHSVFAGALGMGTGQFSTQVSVGLAVMQNLGAAGPDLFLQFKGGAYQQINAHLQSSVADPVRIQPAPGEVVVFRP